MVEVIVGGDQGIPTGVLEADASAIIDTVEVLHGSNDRVYVVVVVDDDS